MDDWMITTMIMMMNTSGNRVLSSNRPSAPVPLSSVTLSQRDPPKPRTYREKQKTGMDGGRREATFDDMVDCSKQVKQYAGSRLINMFKMTQNSLGIDDRS